MQPDFMLNMFPILFFVIFAFVIGGILFTIVKGVSQWSSNNKQPVLTVSSKVVAKRTKVSQNNNNVNGQIQHHSSSTYYVTFEVESGDRMEFRVSDHEFGQLAEDDQGKLTFQGTRYLGYERMYSV
jgi:type III secretory pathway component EscV